jgi:WbqC-like protein
VADRRFVIAIHQPNFFPWLGYFDKLARADIFILLDDVQFPKTGGSWVNRVRLLENGKPAWKTVPVRRASLGLQSIRSVAIADDVFWRAKLLSFLRTYYGAAPAFAEVMPVVSELVEYPTGLLGDFNVHAIDCLRARLGLERARLVRQSDLGVDGHATELLVNLVRAAGGSVYLSGDGSGGYLDPAEFERAGIALEFQAFQHPTYTQRGVTAFVGGLSILDALMHCGFGGVREFFTTARVREGAEAE